MAVDQDGSERYVESIRRSGLSIENPIATGDPNLWIPTPNLETLLNAGLVGVSLNGLPLRTRSKVIKEHICRSLGYPVPASFKRTKPRFLGQNFDPYVQKSNNLQVWNEELEPTRRYVLIRVGSGDLVTQVKVVTGDTLAYLDTTGTLTQKYQAQLIPGDQEAELIAELDTDLLRPFINPGFNPGPMDYPLHQPVTGKLIPISDIFERLHQLIGIHFEDSGFDQERNRGAELHQHVCQYLGYTEYGDNGQFPDVRHQLLEVKLQTSPTIDLGVVRPDSKDPLDVPNIEGQQVRHCDVRYALFYGKTDGKHVTLTHLFLTTGEMFFSRFRQFKGKVLNKKLQIPLPSTFFDADQ